MIAHALVTNGGSRFGRWSAELLGPLAAAQLVRTARAGFEQVDARYDRPHTTPVTAAGGTVHRVMLDRGHGELSGRPAAKRDVDRLAGARGEDHLARLGSQRRQQVFGHRGRARSVVGLRPASVGFGGLDLAFGNGLQGTAKHFHAVRACNQANGQNANQRGEPARHHIFHAHEIGQVGDDPAAFAAAARAHSGCASAQQDGSLGQIRRGELVAEVQSGLEALAEGTTARDPVRSRFGWHILRLHRRIPGRTMPFETVRDRIADMLEARSWSIEAARYVAALAAANQVEGVRIEAQA